MVLVALLISAMADLVGLVLAVVVAKAPMVAKVLMVARVLMVVLVSLCLQRIRKSA